MGECLLIFEDITSEGFTSKIVGRTLGSCWDHYVCRGRTGNTYTSQIPIYVYPIILRSRYCHWQLGILVFEALG